MGLWDRIIGAIIGRDADDDEPLKAEIQSFLESTRTGTTPAVSAEDGFAAVQLADRIVEWVKQHIWDRTT